jgi:hypothetical protein
MPTLTLEQHAKLQHWLSESDELCVDIYLPKSGAGGTQFFVRSVDDLEALISEQTWRELVVTVFRRLQYPLRGTADDSLLAQAFEQIPDGQWCTFIVLENYCYPNRPKWWGSVDTHAELRQELSEAEGRRVGIGRNPFDYDDTWIRSSPDEAMLLYIERRADHYEIERT